MVLKGAHLVNVVITGLLTGNEFGSWAIVHRALDQLPVMTRIQAEHALTRRYGGIMPVFMSAAIASFVPVLALSRDRTAAAFRFGLAGMLCYVVMLAITLTGNVPINNRLVELPAEAASRDEFVELRSRWHRLHTARNALNIAGCILAALSLASSRPKEAE